MNDEAAARQVAVVPRQAAATYRVRGYVTALVDRDKTSFSWVWDVRDTDKRRALRITGEELGPHPIRAAMPGRSADERVLRDISRAGMERIATFLRTPGQPPAAAPETPAAGAGRKSRRFASRPQAFSPDAWRYTWRFRAATGGPPSPIRRSSSRPPPRPRPNGAPPPPNTRCRARHPLCAAAAPISLEQ